jgi:competence protein ComEC
MAERGGAPGRAQGIAGTWPPHGATRAGGLAPSSFGTWSALLEKLRAWVRAEAGAGRLLPWVPIAFGTGVAFYFAADHEPELIAEYVERVYADVAEGIAVEGHQTFS